MLNLDFIALFIFITGFILGLGSVTVIDIHGFLGRKSSYWTEATIRTHKITKPLIWLGIFLVIIGGIILYRNESFSGIPLYHTLISVVLIINGIFLSFYVSPFLLKKELEGKQREHLPISLQNKIIISLIVSDIGWWVGLLLLVKYITN
jgi:NADH:ubiquinone oxidoreductase subunit 5 (subunit L)/multisubunit Na+/H+ antiporter MnhA subunit